MMVLSRANFLMLDEPTNHLDIESVEALEDALEEYEGTILLVSHDRAMLEALTSRVWVLHEQHVTDFPGLFRRVGRAKPGARARGGRRSRGAGSPAASQGAEDDQKAGSARETTLESRSASCAKRSKTRRRKSPRSRAKSAELTALLEDPELYTTREGTERSLVAGKELDVVRRKLDAAIEKWTAATERAEQFSAT